MGVDVLDLTILQKRGLLKQQAFEQECPDVLDLTLPASQATLSSASPARSSSDNSSAFDFLSRFAQASATPSGQSEHPAQSATSSDISGKLDTILSKIEDTMFKIELLSGRVAQLETRFSS